MIFVVDLLYRVRPQGQISVQRHRAAEVPPTRPSREPPEGERFPIGRRRTLTTVADSWVLQTLPTGDGYRGGSAER
jgi:hypothetical protein